MRPDGLLRVSEHHLSAQIDGELFVLDPGSGRLHVLSSSAGRVYGAVDGTRTATDVVDALSAELGAPGDRFEGDIRRALAAMAEQRLLVVDDPSSWAAGLPRVRVGPDPPHDVRTVEGPMAVDDLGTRRAGAAVIRVVSNAPAVSGLLLEPLALLPHASPSAAVDSVISVTDPGDDGPYEIREGHTAFASAVSADEAADAVLAACNQAATTVPSHTVRLHGGVVAFGDRAVVICGESGSGKSSLTAALVRAGWSYLTDEVAIVEPGTWEVTPYPKWVDLSASSLQLIGLDAAAAIGPSGPKFHLPPSAVGTVGERSAVVAIVLLDDSDADQVPNVRELDGRDATLTMLSNVFATTWDDPNGLQAVADLCSAALVVQLARSTLDEMVSLVRALVEW